jgi:uncharacterized protein (TIGR02757 family)
VARTINKSRAHELLEDLYGRLNRSDYIHPDPLETALQFRNQHDREVAALLAALFALGRVDLILDYLKRLFIILDEPYAMLRSSRPQDLRDMISRRVYRFFSYDRLIDLLSAIASVLRRYGSLEAAASVPAGVYRPAAVDRDRLNGSFAALYALENLGSQLRAAMPDGNARLPGIVFPRMRTEAFHRGGAAKRPLLFLRWMVRRDAVDPGGWELIRPAQLLYPLDTHMMDLSGAMGIRSRRGANMASAMEISNWFREIEPEDPVKYDFSLTRLGIHPDLSKESFLNSFNR